jgi:2,3-dihydroxyphenylpropionate 1,2-dioxygenase
MVFPQYDTAPDEKIRHFIVHGGGNGEITMEKWLSDMRQLMNDLAAPTASGEFVNGGVNPEWDERFLAAITSPDLSVFDSWVDADIEKAAGNGAAEIRQWIAAVAAARACGAAVPSLDYLAHGTAIGSAAAVVHASSTAQTA